MYKTQVSNWLEFFYIYFINDLLMILETLIASEIKMTFLLFIFGIKRLNKTMY